MASRFHVGVDENGLGPRLGPLVVTGVLVALDAPLDDAMRAALSRVYRDSKQLCAHGAMGAVEALVLATLAEHLGATPTKCSELQSVIGAQSDDELRARCPADESPTMCFGHDLPLPAFGGGVDDAAREWARWVRVQGMTLRAVSQHYACAEALNHASSQGRNRFDVDLELMIAAVGALRGVAGARVEAVCGKVGGRRAYAAALSQRWPLLSTTCEGAERSTYEVSGVGTLSFERDADARDPTVSLASLIGKYARELSMARIHAWLAERVDGLLPASGYHDPVTARYVDATRLVRAARVSDRCFER